MNRPERGRHLPLPLRARVLTPALVCAAVTVGTVVLFPAAEVYVGAGGAAPRTFGPHEYGPMVLALALSLGLAPRFHDWDRYGAPRTRTLALVNAAVTLLVPLVLFIAVLALPLEIYSTSYTSARELLPYASNIAVAALLASSLVGTVGRLAGTVIWAATLYLLMLWQAATPTYGRLLPLTMHFTADATLDTDMRWVWIIVLALIAGAVAGARRSVPSQISLRPAED